MRNKKTNRHDRTVLNKAIKIACKMAGWSPWFQFSDRRKNHIRVKFAYGDNPTTPAMRKKILTNAQFLLEKSRANATVNWEKLCRPGYGTYNALIVRYPV